MKRCASLTLACLAVGTNLSHCLTIPAPVVFPGLFGPADDVTSVAPVPDGAVLALHFGGVASGSLGDHWMATASGGAVLGSNLLTEIRLIETGARVSLDGSRLQFRLANDPNAILGELSVGAGLSMSWSATATLDVPGNEFTLAPNTTYRLQFHVDTGGGLLNSTLGISPTFGVELLDGAGVAIGYQGGSSIANLIGLPLAPVVGAPAGTGAATVEFRTGASVPAGAAGIRFSGSATLPASVAGIGTEFATISSLSLGEVAPYTLWAEDNGLPAGQQDPEDDPDGDGRSNLDEFALATDPATADDENIHVAIGNADGPGPETSVFVMTLPVRSDASFAPNGNGNQVAVADGVGYQVEGSLELLHWTLAVSEVTPNSEFANPLPELPDGWSYRSFRMPGQTSDTPKAFLRVVIEVSVA